MAYACSCFPWHVALAIVGLQTGDVIGQPPDSQEERWKLIASRNGMPVVKVSPNWKLFSNIDDGRGVIGGVLHLDFAWIETQENSDVMQHARDFIEITNFMGGISGRVSSGLLRVRYREGLQLSSRRYVGEFRQKFDTTCFPFETKVARFDIGFMDPGDDIFELDLYCAEGFAVFSSADEAIPFTRGGSSRTANISRCVRKLDEIQLGISWSEFRCSKKLDKRISCQLTGTRLWSTIMKTYIIPGLLFTAVGFASFALPIKMPMPRVATTMIAMLTLANYRLSLVNMLPKDGQTKIVEELYNWMTIILFVSIMFHIVSIGLDAKGWKHFHIIDDVLKFFLPMAFGLYMASTVYGKECFNHVSSDVVVLFLVFFSCCVVATFVFMLWRHGCIHRQGEQSYSQRYSMQFEPQLVPTHVTLSEAECVGKPLRASGSTTSATSLGSHGKKSRDDGDTGDAGGDPGCDL